MSWAGEDSRTCEKWIIQHRHRRPSSGQGSSRSIVGSSFCVSSTTGIDGLGHDVDGGIVGRGRAEGAIRRKDSASQSMTAAAAVGEVDEFRGTVEYSEW